MKQSIKVFFACVCAYILTISGYGQINSPLHFNKDGKFKIVQFTDIHLKEYNQLTSDSALTVMNTILEREKPDLVLLTGDIATSQNMEMAWDVVTQPMINAEIPWAAVFGNHDYEHGYTNHKIMEYLLTLPFNYSQFGPDDISGSGNYVLEIKDKKSKRTKALLYCLDSNAYTDDIDNPELGKYDWIKFDQIQWYRKTSENYTERNKNRAHPALAFFHIPLPEYKIVQQMETTVGDKDEKVSSPAINSGMYNAMLEMQDVMGVFVGHDHNNNFIGCLNNICLAYGCKTGFESYGSFDKGARVIELIQGKRSFTTWIHTIQHEKQLLVNYPKTFVKPE